jgi:plasmid stabilization system protein ParE
MIKQVIWSPLSENDLETILDYLHKNWNRQVVNRFIDKIENLIEQIANNPKQFPLINKKRKVRKCVITKHNTIFYREHKGTVELLRIFDNRQNPRKRKYE